MPLAELAVNALGSWIDRVPDRVIAHLEFILPLLNEYLRIDSVEYERKVMDSLDKPVQSLKYKTRSTNKQIEVQIIGRVRFIFHSFFIHFHSFIHSFMIGTESSCRSTVPDLAVDWQTRWP